MFKKSLAIILSTSLALGFLVQGSFAYTYPSGSTTIDALLSELTSVGNWSTSASQGRLQNMKDLISSTLVDSNSTAYVSMYFSTSQNIMTYIGCPDGYCVWNNGNLYCSKPGVTLRMYEIGPMSSTGSPSNTYISANGSSYSVGNISFYYVTNYALAANFWNSSQTCYCSHETYRNGSLISPENLLLGSYNPDTRFLDVYMTMSTYGNVRYLCVESDDVILSSTWVSVRYTDQFGSGTYIQDYPFDYFTSNGHSYIKIMPDLISDYEFTVTSVLYSGSSSWGTKEVTGLDLTFNESVFPTPIPSAYPVPDYSYYDTTYINYNGGNPEIIYTPLSSQLTIGFLGSDTSKYYFLDEYPFLYLEQPFSYSFIVIPDIPYEYSSFLGDCIYQYDVVIDDFEITNDNYYQIYSFDYIYGSGAWSNLNGLLSAAQISDVSSILESWYSSHDPIIYQFPYHTNESFSFDDRVYDCSLILTDTFFFKQTNYLLGDTGDILSEFSERFFKIDGFSDSLFDNISSLYNLNLQYYDSSLQALTGLSYWLNDNDISSNLSDIIDLLSSLDSYLSSVDSKLNYLVTIDSDLNDLLEWFQNQEDSDVVLTLPDFNSSILINIYGTNIGDFVEFVQSFVNSLPEFDFSDFPNFFDYAAALVDDTAGSGDDLIGSLFNPYDYDDSGLHEFGWD